MSITTREAKGTEISYGEMDTNFIELRDGINAQVPKTKGSSGIKLGPFGSETYGWDDIVGHLQTYGDPGDATRAAYRGGIKALQFAEGNSAYEDYHIPHTYAPNTNIFVHVHWSHNSSLVTGGSVTWAIEYIYAKGHNQEAFSAPKTISVVSPASTTIYQHMIDETVVSTAGGSAVLLDTALIEADGLIQCRIYLDSNDLTVSSGLKPDPFVHTVDIHYQTTGVGTKDKVPDFWA